MSDAARPIGLPSDPSSSGVGVGVLGKVLTFRVFGTPRESETPK